jgi:biotin synthase
VNRPRSNRAHVAALFDLPFNDLLFQAATVHRQHFDPNAVQLSQLLSIKTGACPEDCSYCPQSARFKTGLERERLMAVETVLEKAKAAKEGGATRYCMGAAWRSPRDKDVDQLVQMVQGVRELGMETCVTAGMLSDTQAQRLSEAGLDYYNHNLDTAPEHYGKIITTRTYADRLDTLRAVRQAGMKVCCGGIVGLGEERKHRVGLLVELANLPTPPESVPINMLVKVPGTPLSDTPALDPIEFVRTIAVARILMPSSHVRLSAGRKQMTDELQSLCFFAGANSIFCGDKLLTTANPGNRDAMLFAKLGLHAEPSSSPGRPRATGDADSADSGTETAGLEPQQEDCCESSGCGSSASTAAAQCAVDELLAESVGGFIDIANLAGRQSPVTI